MGLKRTLLARFASLIAVLVVVLFMVVIVLGATGVSDNILEARISEELRGLRQQLAQRIRDPQELERVMLAQREELVQSYGLDKPWYTRLPDMVRRVLVLDLGVSRTISSFSGSTRIVDIVMERIPNTLLLVTVATAISAAIGITAGVKIATKPGSKIDRVSSYFSAVSFALPTWWTGILLILVLAFQFRIFPYGGMYSAPPPQDQLGRALDLIWHSALPVLTLVSAIVGSWIYGSRTVVLNVAQEDFVNVARAKGLPESIVMRRYIIRVSAPPILTNIILGLAASVGGAILTETVFGWPGMGRLYYDAITSFDETLIVALTYLFTLIYILARFALDVLYIILDPRVRY